MAKKSITEVKTLLKKRVKTSDDNDWLSGRKFNPNQVIEEPPALISIQNNTILTMGNYITISGKPKAGKSAFITALLAGAITGNNCLGWQVRLPLEKNTIIHLDTEQGDWEYYKMMDMCKRIAQINVLPDNFESYRLRGCKAEMIRDAIIQLSSRPKIAMIVIDGLLDTIVDFNDIHECRMITDILRDITERLKIAIVCVIHQSKSTNYTIGHLGSFADRYSQSVIEVVRDNDNQISTLKGVYLRSAGAIEPVNIMYNVNTNMWQFDVTTPHHHKAKPSPISEDDVIGFCDKLFTGRSYVIYKQIEDDAASILKLQKKKVSALVEQMFSLNLVTKDGNNYYRATPPF